MMDLLAEFSPGCDSHFPDIEVVNKCTAVQLANKVLECEKNYLFPYMPLHDDTPEVMLRYGVCVYVSVENCGQETINEYELDQRIGKIVDDIKREFRRLPSGESAATTAAYKLGTGDKIHPVGGLTVYRRH